MFDKCPRPSRQKYGYRVGEIGEADANSVIDFEVEELSNEHIIIDAAKVFKVKPTMGNVKQFIRKCFGEDAQALWLTKTRKRAEELYGYGVKWSADKIKIPKGASIISDLGPDGQLFVYKKQKLTYL